MSRKLWSFVSLLALLVGLIGPLSGPAAASEPAGHGGGHLATGWVLVKFPEEQPACTGLGFIGPVYYDRLDCGFGFVGVSNTTSSSSVRVQFLDQEGNVLEEQATRYRSADDAWQFSITPGNQALNPPAWPAGTITIRVVEVNGERGNFGETGFFLNVLGATVGATSTGLSPGDPIQVTGEVFEIDQIPPLAAPQETGVGADFFLRAVWPDGTLRGPYGPFTADELDGSFQETLPGEATDGLTAGPDTNFQATVSIEVVEASFDDPLTGAWRGERAGAGAALVSVPPDSLIIENRYLSPVGWVKPGEGYTFRLFVKNFTPDPASGAAVAVSPADGMRFTQVSPLSGAGSATINGDGTISWNVGTVEAASGAGSVVKTLVVAARADTMAEDARIVWKDLSTTATLTYSGGPGGLVSESHGPKVIPFDASFDTARYGDRPFPVVPVDFFDRKHAEPHTGDSLALKINSPDVEGSTFNLYQEMSLGQLFPQGEVPSAGAATADFSVDWKSDRYTDGQFEFTEPAPQGACLGTTFKDLHGSSVYAERIVNGWYQLPGDTQYYGGDRFSAGALAGAIFGIGLLFDIDNACGPTGKAVYDAAHVADPEIDYNQFDTDKDGVVDFFMMVFVGEGGNGVSQTSVPPYDNIWPHSSSLEFYYTDPETGLKGYISDDQLESLEQVPQCWTSTEYTTFDDCAANGGAGRDSLPVYVRVGPYNVNPESAIDNASVISHEYGHSLGLPDFYSVGSRETYGDWNLMATDKSQHMDVFSKQELGWVVPRFIGPDETITANGWRDSKLDTGQIDWVDANGNAYTLSAANGDQGVHNAETYMLKLPARRIIDPAVVANGASPDHVWWSGSGNDFGCPPQGGHNLDIFLPELADQPAGTTVTVEFSSLWNIEWDFDYGFVLVSTDGGSSYQSVQSLEGYSTPQGQNPNASSCQAQFGNGLTGTTRSYQNGTQDVDRLAGEYPEPDGFVSDSYDISFAAGSAAVLRFSYATDAGLARPGWFIDDLRVTAGGQVIYETDFESGADDPRLFNGGCRGSTRVAEQCTDGWNYVSAAEGSPADHGYYLEMRDRSGFDRDGKGENDRPPIGFAAGLLLVISDEAHGYGNVGVDDPPAQSPVDSRPVAEDRAPNLDDAAFKRGDGYSDFGPDGWVDNYTDPAAPDELWRHLFDCLSFMVDSMSGQGVGPADAPGDLIGDVTFTAGPGCATFDFGLPGPGENNPPTAVAQARPTQVEVGETVRFDGSASFDDLTPPAQLQYEWDFEGDGTFDATGQTVEHAYGQPGEYDAVLRVTDEGGLTGEDTVRIRVSGEEEPTPEPAADAKTAGGGWLADADGDKINFGFEVQAAGGGLSGQLQLNDHAGGVKIHLTNVDSVTEVAEPCGGVVAGENALEFRGQGSYNGETGAGFRVCVEDNGEPGNSRAGDTPDKFYLECLSGCEYTTGGRAPDDTLDGGNLQVRRGPEGDEGIEPAPATLILDPLLLDESLVGEMQVFTVLVFDQSLDRLADASVTLMRTTADGTSDTLTVITDLDGVATFSWVTLDQTTEYMATAGDTESNAVQVSPLLE